MNPKLKEKLLESLMAVLPITLIVLALSVALVPMDVGTAVMFTVGAVLLVFGMGLFQLGAEMAMTPLGEGIGVQMERVKKCFSVSDADGLCRTSFQASDTSGTFVTVQIN